MQVDRHPGASRGTSLSSDAYAKLHDTAARQDGLVKIILGLLLAVVTPATAAMLLMPAHLLHASPYALLCCLGVPVLGIAVFGVVLMLWGAAKLLTGRGDG